MPDLISLAQQAVSEEEGVVVLAAVTKPTVVKIWVGYTRKMNFNSIGFDAMAEVVLPTTGGSWTKALTGTAKILKKEVDALVVESLDGIEQGIDAAARHQMNTSPHGKKG